MMALTLALMAVAICGTMVLDFNARPFELLWQIAWLPAITLLLGALYFGISIASLGRQRIYFEIRYVKENDDE